MNKIMCGTTLRNYGWQEGWYVADGDVWGNQLNHDQKRVWLQQQEFKWIETVAGWSFSSEQAALQFVLTWG